MTFLYNEYDVQPIFDFMRHWRYPMGDFMKKKSRKHLWKHGNIWMQAGNLIPGRCETCGENLLYFFKYDANCCPRCDEWTDKKCGDLKCGFCAIKPEYPSIGLYYWQIEDKSIKSPKLYFRLKYAKRIRKQNKRLRIRRISKKKQQIGLFE